MDNAQQKEAIRLRNQSAIFTTTAQGFRDLLEVYEETDDPQALSIDELERLAIKMETESKKLKDKAIEIERKRGTT